jgi:hypothetical protein
MFRTFLTVVILSLSVCLAQTTPTCHSMVPGAEGSLGGFVPFGPNSLWNQDISTAAVHPNSAAFISFIGNTTPVHPDFGAGLYEGSTMGIPYIITSGSQPNGIVHFTAYGSESDPSPMPIPSTAPIEGYPAPGSGDRHVLVLNNSTCWLYELYSAYPNSDGSWSAASAAVWDLNASKYRPWGWTSADAAGLPIFPGLVRYDEILNGHIDHALRFTLQHSRAQFILPARHWAGNSSNAYAAPMGLRLRLKASFDISKFSKTNQIILTALKKYGMIMADNGSSMYLSGTPDDRWNNDDLHNLGQIKASDFEVVNPAHVYSGVPSGAPPVITSFTSSSYSVPKGTKVTLSWAATGVTYYHIAPLGMVRGTTLVTTVSKTTTYTLTATGQFGRSHANLTVTVQ